LSRGQLARGDAPGFGCHRFPGPERGVHRHEPSIRRPRVARLAAYSLATGVIYLGAFAGIVVGSNGPRPVAAFVILAFTVAVVLGWAWISAVTALARADM